MVRDNNSDRVAEAEKHFKSGASSKNRMKRRCLQILFLTMILLIGAISCNKYDEPDADNIRKKFLVDKIYNYDDILVAEYFYDNNNRLMKQVIPENLGNKREEWAGYTEEFEYIDGRVSKIKHRDVSYNMFNYDTYVFYNAKKQLIKSEIHINEQLYSQTTYHYNNESIVGVAQVDESGGLEQFSIDSVVYDNSMNVTELTYILQAFDGWGMPIQGQYVKSTEHYKYDNVVKPNFGIDYLFIYNPLPFMGSKQLAMCISKNNITEIVGETTWTYTYENGLPSTIEMKWKDIETIDPDTGEPFPMLLKIKYKQIK